MRAVEVEQVLAELGSGQWGLLTAVQAQRRGVNRPRLGRLVEAGVLVRLTHGVYALRGSMAAGPVELRAAWLALDPTRPAADRIADGAAGAVVSHASAAVLHGLGDLDADRHEFTAPVRKQTRRAELRLHRGRLADDEVTLHEGLPVTTVARTIVDLVAAGHDGGHVAGVLASAVRARRVDPAALAPLLAPHAARFGLPRHDGPALVAHLLDLGGVTEDVDADRVAAAARSAGISVPDVMALTALTAFTAQLEAQLAPLRQQIDATVRLHEQMTAPARAILDELRPTAAWQAQLRDVVASPVHAQLAEQLAAHQRALEPSAAVTARLQEVAAQLHEATAPVRDLAASMSLQQPPLDVEVATVERAMLAAASPRARRSTPTDAPSGPDHTDDPADPADPDDAGS